MTPHVIQDHHLGPLSMSQALGLLIRPPGRPGATVWSIEVMDALWSPLLVLVGTTETTPQPDGYGVHYQALYCAGVARAHPLSVGLYTLGVDGGVEGEGAHYEEVRQDLRRLAEGPSRWRWLVLA